MTGALSLLPNALPLAPAREPAFPLTNANALDATDVLLSLLVVAVLSAASLGASLVTVFAARQILREIRAAETSTALAPPERPDVFADAVRKESRPSLKDAMCLRALRRRATRRARLRAALTTFAPHDGGGDA